MSQSLDDAARQNAEWEASKKRMDKKADLKFIGGPAAGEPVDSPFRKDITGFLAKYEFAMVEYLADLRTHYSREKNANEAKGFLQRSEEFAAILADLQDIRAGKLTKDVFLTDRPDWKLEKYLNEATIASHRFAASEYRAILSEAEKEIGTIAQRYVAARFFQIGY